MILLKIWHTANKDSVLKVLQNLIDSASFHSLQKLVFRANRSTVNFMFLLFLLVHNSYLYKVLI